MKRFDIDWWLNAMPIVNGVLAVLLMVVCIYYVVKKPTVTVTTDMIDGIIEDSLKERGMK